MQKKVVFFCEYIRIYVGLQIFSGKLLISGI